MHVVRPYLETNKKRKYDENKHFKLLIISNLVLKKKDSNEETAQKLSFTVSPALFDQSWKVTYSVNLRSTLWNMDMMSSWAIGLAR